MKIIKTIVIMLSVICCVAGCRDSYISNKNTNNIEENSTLQDKEDIEENYTTPSIDNTDDKNGFSMYTNMLVRYKDSKDGELVDVRKELLEIDEDINFFSVSILCRPDASSGWNEFPVRLYLIDNGEIIPFSIDGGEYKLWNEIMCTTDKKKTMEISFERLELNSEVGQLCVLAIFNSKELPGLGIYSFKGTQGFAFNYSNAKYSGECVNDVEQADGEYIDIPQEYIENARVTEIGPSEIYVENYIVKNIHYPNDLKVNNTNELYLYMNTGEAVSGCGVVGIVCDGELLQFDDGNYFKKFNSYNGEKTFRYNLGEFDNVEDGLHYFQVIYMPLDDKENTRANVSLRYRVNIRGDK